MRRITATVEATAMAQPKAEPADEALKHAPPDIATMRDTVDRLLDPDSVPDAFPPVGEELSTLTTTVRGHIELLAPEVEQAARTLKPGSIAKYSVLACAWEARSRLEATPSPRTGGAVGHARRLARVLNALCDHYENITGEAPHARR